MADTGSATAVAPPGTAAILLAAGQSSRLGRPKQLVLVEGEPLLCRTARLALCVGCCPVVVVLGAGERACREALNPLLAAHPESLWIVSNPDWRDGMSTSIRAGLAACTASDRSPSDTIPNSVASSAPIPVPKSILVLVTDQARLTADSLQALLHAHATGRAPITAARYGGQLGVPAIFRSELFPALAALTGDQGARRLIDGSPVTPVDLPEADFDVDTPADLADLASKDQNTS